MQLHVEERGHGPVRIALLHGFLGAGSVWTDVVSAADPERYTFLLVDLRGHGASPRADRSKGERYDVPSLAADVVESLPTGLDAIVGHSLGGRVLADVVGPLRPGRAVYLDPGFGLRLPRRGVGARLFWALPGLPALLAWLYDRTDAATGPANVAIVEAAHRVWDRTMVAELLHDVAVRPIEPAAPVVPSTLVLSDQGSLVVPRADLRRYAELGWDLVRMRGIGHDMPLLDGARTARAIERAV
jgi:pimeloyl-ACP methyl ester carboxylesterase